MPWSVITSLSRSSSLKCANISSGVDKLEATFDAPDEDSVSTTVPAEEHEDDWSDEAEEAVFFFFAEEDDEDFCAVAVLLPAFFRFGGMVPGTRSGEKRREKLQGLMKILFSRDQKSEVSHNN